MIPVIYKKPCHAIHVTRENYDAVFKVLEGAGYTAYGYKDGVWGYIQFYKDEDTHHFAQPGDWLVLDPADNTVIKYSEEEFTDTFYRESFF